MYEEAIDDYQTAQKVEDHPRKVSEREGGREGGEKGEGG